MCHGDGPSGAKCATGTVLAVQMCHGDGPSGAKCATGTVLAAQLQRHRCSVRSQRTIRRNVRGLRTIEGQSTPNSSLSAYRASHSSQAAHTVGVRGASLAPVSACGDHPTVMIPGPSPWHETHRKDRPRGTKRTARTVPVARNAPQGPTPWHAPQGPSPWHETHRKDRPRGMPVACPLARPWHAE